MVRAYATKQKIEARLLSRLILCALGTKRNREPVIRVSLILFMYFVIMSTDTWSEAYRRTGIVPCLNDGLEMMKEFGRVLRRYFLLEYSDRLELSR